MGLYLVTPLDSGLVRSAFCFSYQEQKNRRLFDQHTYAMIIADILVGIQLQSQHNNKKAKASIFFVLEIRDGSLLHLLCKFIWGGRRGKQKDFIKFAFLLSIMTST